jgi:hypothetical protein
MLVEGGLKSLTVFGVEHDVHLVCEAHFAKIAVDLSPTNADVSIACHATVPALLLPMPTKATIMATVGGNS